MLLPAKGQLRWAAIMAPILGVHRARTLYNLADAMLPGALARRPDGSSIDLLPAFEASLRHEGLGSIRRNWVLLVVLDWWPVLAGPDRRRFWRLDRTARADVIERLSRLPILGPATTALRHRLLRAAEASAGPLPVGADGGSPQSLEGA